MPNIVWVAEVEVRDESYSPPKSVFRAFPAASAERAEITARAAARQQLERHESSYPISFEVAIVKHVFDGTFYQRSPVSGGIFKWDNETRKP